MTVLTNIREITDSQIKAGHSQIHTVLINLKDFQRHDTQQESCYPNFQFHVLNRFEDDLAGTLTKSQTFPKTF